MNNNDQYLRKPLLPKMVLLPMLVLPGRIPLWVPVAAWLGNTLPNGWTAVLAVLVILFARALLDTRMEPQQAALLFTLRGISSLLLIVGYLVSVLFFVMLLLFSGGDEITLLLMGAFLLLLFALLVDPAGRRVAGAIPLSRIPSPWYLSAITSLFWLYISLSHDFPFFKFSALCFILLIEWYIFQRELNK